MSYPKSTSPAASLDTSPVLGYRRPTSPPQPVRSASTTPLTTHAHVFPPMPSPTSFDKDAEGGFSGAKGSGPPEYGRRRRRALLPVGAVPWGAVGKYVLMLGPLLSYALTIALVAAALGKKGNAFGTLREVGGTGRLDFGITGQSAHATPPRSLPSSLR